MEVFDLEPATISEISDKELASIRRKRMIGFSDQPRLRGLYWNGHKLSNRGRVELCVLRIIGSVKYPKRKSI